MKQVFHRLINLISAGAERNFARENVMAMLKRYQEDRTTTLEIGCSLGETYLQHDGGCYIGTDLRLDFLQTFQSETKAVKSKLVQADAFNLPFADNSIQLIYVLGTLELIEIAKVMNILQECARIGQEDAVFVFQFFNPRSIQYKCTKDRHWRGEEIYSYHPLKRRESLDLLKAFGYSIIEEFNYVLIPYFLVNKINRVWFSNLDLFLSRKMPGFAAKNLYICTHAKKYDQDVPRLSKPFPACL